jgi:hypothetical protein
MSCALTVSTSILAATTILLVCASYEAGWVAMGTKVSFNISFHSLIATLVLHH